MALLSDHQRQAAVMYVLILLCLEEIPAALPYVLPLVSPDFCQLRTFICFLADEDRLFSPRSFSVYFKTWRALVWGTSWQPLVPRGNGFNKGYQERNFRAAWSSHHTTVSVLSTILNVFMFICNKEKPTSSEFPDTSGATAPKSPKIYKWLLLWLPG